MFASLKKNRAQTSRIIKALFSESLNLQLILEIFDNPFKTRQDYCRGLRISEASFYRAIKNINKVLKSYGFLIQFNQGGYYLRGKNEDELRKFIVSLYLETKTMEECFIRIPFKLLKKLVGDNVLGFFPLILIYTRPTTPIMLTYPSFVKVTILICLKVRSISLMKNTIS